MGGTSDKSELDEYGVWVKNNVHPVADKNEEIIPTPPHQSAGLDDKIFLENAAISKAIATEVSKLDEVPSHEVDSLQTDNLGAFLEQNAQAGMLPPDAALTAQNGDAALPSADGIEPFVAGVADTAPDPFAQQPSTGGVDLSAFMDSSPATSPDGEVDLSAFMTDTPDGEVDLSAFMTDSPAPAQGTADGEVDISAFMDSSPASSPDGEVDLSAFLGGDDGEIDLSSFMGDSSFQTSKEEQAQVQDEEPLDLDLEFEDAPFQMQDENESTPVAPQTADSNLDDYQSLLGGFAQEASQMQDASGMTPQEEPPAPSSGEEEIDLSAFGFDDSPDALPQSGNAPKEKKVETVVDYVMNVDIEEEEEESEKREVKVQDDDAADDDDEIKVDISQDSGVAEQKKQETDFSSPDDSFDLDAIFSNIEDESGNTVNFFADEAGEGTSDSQTTPELPTAQPPKDDVPKDLEALQEDSVPVEAMESFLQATAQASAQVDETLAPSQTPTVSGDEAQEPPPPVDNETDTPIGTPDIETTIAVMPLMEDEGFAEGKDFLKEKGLLEDEEPAFAKGTEDITGVEPEWDLNEESAITENELQNIENKIADGEEISPENVNLTDIITGGGQQTLPVETDETLQADETDDQIPAIDAEELKSLEALDLTAQEDVASTAEALITPEPLTQQSESEPASENVAQAQERPLTLQEDELASFHEPVPILSEAALDMAVLSEPSDLDETDETSDLPPLSLPEEEILEAQEASQDEDIEELLSPDEGESTQEPVLVDETSSGVVNEPTLGASEDAQLMNEDNVLEESEQKIENDEVETMNDEEKKKADELDVSSYIDKGPDYDMTGVTVTLDDLEKMEETPVVEPESISPLPQEENIAEDTGEDTEKQVYSVFVCSETTSSGEIDEEGSQEEDVEPKEKESESVAILQKIAQELESLKAEISGLRDEFEQLKKSGIPAETSEKDESAPQGEEGGFFNDDDGDDTIALSGDELSNILNTAEFTSQDAESLEQEEGAASEDSQQEAESQAAKGETSAQSETIPQAEQEDEKAESVAEPAEEATVASTETPPEPVQQLETQEGEAAEETSEGESSEVAATEVSTQGNVAQEEAVEAAETPAPAEDTSQEKAAAETVQESQVEESSPAIEAVPDEQDSEPEIAQAAENTAQAEQTPETQEAQTTEDAPLQASDIAHDVEPSATEVAQEESLDTVQVRDQEQPAEPAQEVSSEEAVEPVAPQDVTGEATQEVQDTPDVVAETEVTNEAPVVADVQEPQTDEAEGETAEDVPAEQTGETLSEAQLDQEASVTEEAQQQIAQTTEPEESAEPIAEAQEASETVAQEATAEAQAEAPVQEAAGVISEEDIPSPTLESLNLPTLSETYKFPEEESEPLTEDNIEYLKSDVPEEFDEEEDEENIETGISEQPVDVFSNWGAKGEIEEEASEPDVSATAEAEEEISVAKPQSETTVAAPVAEEASPASDATQEATSTPDVAEQTASLTTEDTASDLMAEIKAVLTYMDRLLESLPEEKIEEFARSEQFETYKKLFVELGLA